MAEKFGLAPDQCTGLHCYQIVHGLMEPPGFCPHSQTCRDGKEHLSEVYDPALGGTFLVSTTPIFDNQGKFIGSTHVARDITERKLAEEALKQRTLELEASNKELEAFSYTVSHDLRAPLRSMDGYSQALLEEYAGQLDQQGRKWLKRIRASSQMMAQLIDDILGLSRVVRAELQIQTVNLSEIAGSVIKELQAACPERQVEFVITPDIKTQGDLNLLRILMSNLLGNAFKFTSRCSGARIEFGAAEIDNRLYYFVRDNGAGFDMKYADKLFKPFQRLHSVEEFPGTGIGLATVQRIILRHGGEIKAESRPGRGATFYFSLNGI
jgi:light-regulated signal transduction histidine kinase (bacteriophytochrome)